MLGGVAIVIHLPRSAFSSLVGWEAMFLLLILHPRYDLKDLKDVFVV